VYKSLIGKVKKTETDSSQLFLVKGQEATATNRCRKYHLNIRKSNFTKRVIEYWNWLPREVVNAPSLEIFKIPMDVVLGNLL